jgi:hypothetical protein
MLCVVEKKKDMQASKILSSIYPSYGVNPTVGAVLEILGVKRKWENEACESLNG